MNAAESKGMQITIMGRSFRVACPEHEQQGLLEAVDYLNFSPPKSAAAILTWPPLSVE
jgi:hypothetical protein